MQKVGQVLKDITSTKSRVFKEVLETAICECGKSYDSRYILHVFDKKTEHTQEECDSCYMEKKERKLARSILKANQEQKMKNIQSLFESDSLMNPKLAVATFESYQPTSQALDKAKSYLMRYAEKFTLDKPISLLLIGNCGTGKSHLSVSVIKALMERSFTCLFISTPKLLSKIRSTYNKKSEYSDDKIIETLSKVDCLVLDDIGAEQTKQANDDYSQDWSTSKLFEVIDNRIGKATIFTSNFEIEELKERLGARNFSRMMEDVSVIKMYGDDYRLRKFKKAGE